MDKCPICASTDVFMKYPDTLHDDLPAFDYNFTSAHNRTYKIMKCKVCGHAFSILPNPEIWKNYQSVVDQAYLSRQEEREMTYSKLVKTIKGYARTGKLLDVGCATGDFLSSCRNDYDAEGLELSEWSAEIAKQRGFKIHNIRLENLPETCTYDIVTLWGVIEHFEDPTFELEQIHRILKKGGLVCLWTGDIDSLPSKLLNKRWWYIQGQHVQLFSKKSLRLLFLKAGFSEVKIGRYPYTTNLQSIYKSIGRYPLLQTIARSFLLNRIMANKTLTLSLPGEMFAIFRK